MRRVLVLGAGGFIGRRIVAALATSGWALPVAALRRPGAVAGAAETVMLDATSEAAIEAALPGVDAVVNSVAGAPQAIVANARALFAAAARQPRPPRIVHLSTMSVYGSLTGLIDETAATGAGLAGYGAAKWQAERSAAAYPDGVLLRPGIVYGPGSREWSLLIGRLLLARRLGDLGAAGEGGCNLVHVDDVARAVLAALPTPDIAGQCFNLSLGETPSWNAYFHAYAAALGVAPQTISPRRLALELKLFGPLIKLGERARLSLPIPIRPWLIDQCRQDIRLDVRRAETILGLRWTPLPLGLRETADWLLAAR